MESGSITERREVAPRALQFVPVLQPSAPARIARMETKITSKGDVVR